MSADLQAENAVLSEQFECAKAQWRNWEALALAKDEALLNSSLMLVPLGLLVLYFKNDAILAPNLI